ncbi:MAG TPA: trehalose-phosphatase [Gemmatimonadaceae bacterium]|nr:trehalose-phosphatase [Gemmatimonadaceae bacterium]
MTRPLLPVTADVATRLAGAPLLLMLDVDGTLAPIAPRPEDAAVPPDTRRVVEQLAAHPRVTVAFVSGRAASDVARLTGVPGAWVVGNHGFEIVRPDGLALDPGPLGGTRDAVAGALREIAQVVSATPGALVEDKRWTASVHFRLADAKATPALRAAIDGAAARHGLRVMEGKKVFEIRPNEDVNKGTVALRLTRELANGGNGAVVYLGDDATDEDAFASLRASAPAAITARVTNDDGARTAAEFSLEDTNAVTRFLSWLAAERGVSAPNCP